MLRNGTNFSATLRRRWWIPVVAGALLWGGLSGSEVEASPAPEITATPTTPEVVDTEGVDERKLDDEYPDDGYEDYLNDDDQDLDSDEDVVEPGEPEEVLDREQAVTSAQELLAANPLSRNALISRLEFAGFIFDDAIYAVDNLGADWEAQAVRATESALRRGGLSKFALLNNLTRAGFSAAQAEYGINTAAVDWYDQAVMAAEWHINDDITRDELLHELIMEGFTQSEAEDAATAVGL